MHKFGDLAQADLSELQARLGAAVTHIRQLEGKHLQQEQRMQQLARGEKELEQCLRRLGMGAAPMVGRGWWGKGGGRGGGRRGEGEGEGEAGKGGRGGREQFAYYLVLCYSFSAAGEQPL